jgi:hypothetical protein
MPLELLNEQAYWADQTMLNGIDNRHESWEVQTAAQELAAGDDGLRTVVYSVGSSRCPSPPAR